MGYKQKRRVVRFGATSRGITLPRGWLEFYGLKEHDSLILMGDSLLVVARLDDEEEAQNLLTTMERKLRKKGKKKL